MARNQLTRDVSRRGFGRNIATLVGAGVAGTSALGLAVPKSARADTSQRKGYFDVDALPFHLQHEFDHAVSCNNIIAKAVEVTIEGERQHAVEQRPGTFGWGLISFFLQFDPKLIGTEMTFFSTIGWNGKANGEVAFSVDINGDIVIDGGRSTKETWAEIERKLEVKSREMRVTLMLDSIRGDNDFSFWWAEPQLKA